MWTVVSHIRTASNHIKFQLMFQICLLSLTSTLHVLGAHCLLEFPNLINGFWCLLLKGGLTKMLAKVESVFTTNNLFLSTFS